MQDKIGIDLFINAYNYIKNEDKYLLNRYTKEGLKRAGITTKDINVMEFAEEYNKLEEQAIMGNLLTGEEDRIKAVVEVIDIGKFYIEEHKKIYNAILKLYKESKKINILSVKETLKETGELEEIGGQEYLADLIELSGEGKEFRDYIESIKNRQTKI